jgi:hypothetical protein
MIIFLRICFCLAGLMASFAAEAQGMATPNVFAPAPSAAALAPAPPPALPAQSNPGAPTALAASNGQQALVLLDAAKSQATPVVATLIEEAENLLKSGAGR